MNRRATYDAPWKEILEAYLADFLALACPALAAEIDWRKGYEPLDKELNAIAPDGETGPRTVDKLVKVWQANGDETWVLLHLELQAQPDSQFAERMWIYYYRLFDRYRKPVVSLAILADSQANWRPQVYHQALWGCRMEFEFLVCKLLDFSNQQAALSTSKNPFAVVILAHLAALTTRHNNQARLHDKLSLTRSLYDKGLDKTGILNLYSFIDAVLALPRVLELEYLEQIEQFEQEQAMPYITSAERIGIEKGLEQGIAQGIKQGIAQGKEQGIAQGIEQGIAQGKEQGIAQGKEQGRHQGEQAAKVSIARKLLAQGLASEAVSQLTELGLSEIQILLKELSSH